MKIIKKILSYIWIKIDGKKTIIFNSLAAYLQYLIDEDILDRTKFLSWAIKTLLFLGMLSLGHKGIKKVAKNK